MAPKTTRLKHSRLLEVLTYDALTGVFMWRIPLSPRRPAGAVAGTLNKQGYLVLNIDGVQYKQARLAWFYVYGVWPDKCDHKFGDQVDNRISELRDLTTAQNSQSRHRPDRDSASGVLGVYWQSGKWVASVKVNGKKTYLGRFTDLRDAEAASLAARRLNPVCVL